MNEKLKTMMSSKKTKVATIATCAALVLSIGTMSAFAAADAERKLVKNENGIVSHSTDDGATWQEGAPEGFTQIINEDGSAFSYVGNPPDANADSFAVRNENGVTSYSTDGGMTWSEVAPEGYAQNADGSISYKTSNSDGRIAEKSLVKNEDGIVSHSTDDGATWLEGAPEGFTQIVNEDGTAFSYVGNPPDASADSFTVRNENGVTSYSTDGGMTWSEEAPEGYTQNEDGSVGFKFGN